MIKQAFTLAFQDLWEDAFFLLLFNFICVISLIFYPFTLFGLFASVHDVGQQKGVKLATFFRHIQNTWRDATIWGVINYAILIVAWFNLSFYAQINALWAMVIQWVVIGLLLAWGLTQLLALGVYAHLTEPSYKLALQNAAAIVGLYPITTLSFMVIILCLLTISAIMPIIFFVGLPVFIAAFTNRLIEVIFKCELRKQEERS